MILISAQDAQRMVHDGAPVALLDIREAGQFGEGHALFAVPAPYSKLELLIEDLVPCRSERIILMDEGDGVAARAAERLAVMGYDQVHVLDGGVPGWAAAGLHIYKGVNVPTKTLGELAEHIWQPEFLAPNVLRWWKETGKPFDFFDARPPAEYGKMRVPGSVCLPNGELAHRISALDRTEDEPVLITCAGRTRGIIGAVGLKLSGYDGPVFALENGTQGWALAGEALERGNTSAPYPKLDALALASSRQKAHSMMTRFCIPQVDGPTAVAMLSENLGDCSVSTYLFDTRSAAEAVDDPVPGAVHALSGQLVQAADQWIGVRHGRLILCCDTGLRSALAAFWLRQIGYDAQVLLLEGETRSALGAIQSQARIQTEKPALISPHDALEKQDEGALMLDIRGSMRFRDGHIRGALWAIRPRLADALAGHDGTVLLIADSRDEAALVGKDLRDLGVSDVLMVAGGYEALVQAGAQIETGAGVLPDEACIDHLFFVHDRHDGNLESSRRYLAWETGLIAQLSDEERAEFWMIDPNYDVKHINVNC